MLINLIKFGERIFFHRTRICYTFEELKHENTLYPGTSTKFSQYKQERRHRKTSTEAKHKTRICECMTFVLRCQATNLAAEALTSNSFSNLATEVVISWRG